LEKDIIPGLLILEVASQLFIGYTFIKSYIGELFLFFVEPNAKRNEKTDTPIVNRVSPAIRSKQQCTNNLRHQG
jgi:hypothetical protein